MHFFFFFTLVCKNVLYILCASCEKNKLLFRFGFPFTNELCSIFGGRGDQPGRGEEEEATGVSHPTAVSLPLHPGCTLLVFGAP